MDLNETHEENTYRIRVKETLDDHIIDWFGNLTLIPQENGETILVGSFTDQPALRGFLDQLWNLNITVISVERISNEN
jgi:hypothetical protein